MTSRPRRLPKRSKVARRIEDLETRALLTAYLVTTNLDEIIDNDTLSLREAVELANANPGEDSIAFASSADGSIDLDGDQLDITDSLTIIGNGATRTIINAQHNSRVFDVSGTDVNVTFDHLAITNGQTDSDNEGGAGVRFLSNGVLTVTNCLVSGNVTTGTGSSGAGIYAADGTVSVTASTVSNNSTSGSDSSGGGVRVDAGSLSFVNSTISGNSTASTAVAGGGVSVGAASLNLNGSTVALNSAAGTTLLGGGIFVETGDVSITNSIVALNTNAGAPDLTLGAGIVTVSNSLIGDATGTSLVPSDVPDGDGNIIGSDVAPVDPLLGSLALNGGQTPTHALLTGSPAIDVGNESWTSTVDDQRGLPFVRVSGINVDMGAVEAQPLTLQVTTENDEDDGVLDLGDLSLREAIAFANAFPGTDVISFAPELNGVPLLLTLGELTITDAVSINGSGTDFTVIDAQNGSRVFDVTSAAGNVTFTELSVINGHTTAADQGGAGIRYSADGVLTLLAVLVNGNTTEGDDAAGGGILLESDSTLVLTNSTVSANTTLGLAAVGGGIAAPVGGTVTITNSRVSSNVTSGNDSAGGGVYISTGTLSLNTSTIADNRTEGTGASGGGVHSSEAATTAVDSTIADNVTAGADAPGGGLFVSDAVVSLTSSTVSGNLTQGENGFGGGVRVETGSLTLVNGTISGNSASGTASAGGGLSVDSATLSLTNCTVAFNNSGDTTSGGGGISAGTADVTILNSIVADNTNLMVPDLSPGLGALTVEYSLIGINVGTNLASTPLGSPDDDGNLIGSALAPIEPQLGVLAAYTGPTKTHSLLGISPAINAGNNDLAAGLDFDQRGLPRDFNGTVDMGAFEQQSAPAEPTVSFSVAAQSVSESVQTVTLTVNLAFASPRHVTVPFSAEGTAHELEDFSFDLVSVFIPAGSLSATFTMTIVDDNVYEANETAVVTFGVPTNAIVGSTPQQTITITNNDPLPTVSLSKPSDSVDESADFAEYVVVLSAISQTETIVPITVSGTATIGTDYTNDATFVVIPAGQLSATLSIALIDNDTVESSETVRVTLGTPTNAILGAVTSETITIVDDDNSAPEVVIPGTDGIYRFYPRSQRRPVQVFAGLTVSDPDGGTEIGKIVFSKSLPGGRRNRDKVKFAATNPLGTMNDVTTADRREWTLTLKTGVTTAQVQAFLLSITFETTGSSLDVPQRDFKLQLTDRGGLSNAVVTKMIQVTKY